MIRVPRALGLGVTHAAIAAAVILCAVPALRAGAAPTGAEVVRVATAAPLASTTTATIGPSVASLEASSFATPIEGTFGYTARVRVPRNATSVLMRLRVLNPSGRLMIQRTRIDNDIDGGRATASFERTIADLDLAPGAYPVTLDVQVSAGGAIAEKTLRTDLLVYDAKKPAVPVVLAVRVSGQPLADPQGKFIADPGQFTRARDDVLRLASWVVDQPDARMTLAISPLLLEEWGHISDGYEVAGPEGAITVPIEDPVPREYARTLDMITSAVGTGRLELAMLGYADPDLAELNAHYLAGDVAPQYAAGISAVFASLETTPSTGTVPAGGCIPPVATAALSAQGTGYAVVRAACARSGQTTAAPGAYVVRGSQGLIALVADDRAARAITTGSPARAVRRVFDRHAADAASPVVIRGEVGAGQLPAEGLIEAAEAMDAQPWARLRLGRDVAARTPRKSLTLRGRRSSTIAPAGYWSDVRASRKWARALAYASRNSQGAVTADKDSLIAECSAWAGPDGSWALADRGRAFADTAQRLGHGVLDGIGLKVEAVTLAGTRGEVPIIITNDTQSPLALKMSADPQGGLVVVGDRTLSIDSLPKDNFLELPVDLRDRLSGRLTVTLSAGGLVLDKQTVTVRASYLDRLVVFGGVILVLGVMLAFIIRRVRAAESHLPDAEDDDSDTFASGTYDAREATDTHRRRS